MSGRRLPPASAPAPPPGPQALGSPKPPAAASGPVIQVACPEARRPGGGDHRRRSQPPARAADWEVSPREGGEERGTPGNQALGLLIPLKVADQRRLFQAKAVRWGRSGLGLSRLCWGSRAKDPRVTAQGELASLRGEDHWPLSLGPGKSPKRPYRDLVEFFLPRAPREGCAFLWPPENRTLPARHLTCTFSFNPHSNLVGF
jgi:hypothetical protein